MAHKKGASSSRNGRDSNAQRLGVKRFGGEQVKAVIMLKPGYAPSDALAQEILDFGRKTLPAFKVPRSLDFVTDLPRSEAGKIQRNKVRAPYWEGRTRQI